MVEWCCVKGCRSRSMLRRPTGEQRKIRFFRFPALKRTGRYGPQMEEISKRRRLAWRKAVRRKFNQITPNTRVCSLHFHKGQPAYEMMESDPDWAPSLNLGPANKLAEARSARLLNRTRHRELMKRKRDGMLTSAAQHRTTVGSAEHSSSNTLLSAGEDVEEEWADYNSLKLQHSRLQDAYTELHKEANSLWAENERLKEELQNNLPRFSYSSVKRNEEQVLFLSSLPSGAFDWLVTQITVRAERVHPELTLHDHLLVVLMKLKLGLCDTDLAYRFRIQKSFITIICQRWIPALAAVLRPLITRPCEDAVLKNRPRIFRSKFKRCRCIIDCVEVTVARNSKTITTSQTNTIKYFIGVTPAGAVSFLSAGFSETFTDRQIIKECGFLHLLEPLDEILANRPFLIREELAPFGVSLHTPDFIKGKKMLKCGFEKQWSRVWTHVRRVLGWWKDYNIFQKVIPSSYAGLLDDVVTACVGLTNLNLSLVPKATDHS